MTPKWALLMAAAMLVVVSAGSSAAGAAGSVYWAQNGGHKGDPHIHHFESGPFAVRAPWIIQADIDCGHLPGVRQFATVTVWDQSTGEMVFNHLYTKDRFVSWRNDYQPGRDYISVTVGTRNCAWSASVYKPVGGKGGAA